MTIGEPIIETQSALQTQVLQLERPIFHAGGSYYPNALVNQAIPFVEMLVKLKESSTVRTNPILAEYDSDRGGEHFLYSKAWNNDLMLAICDLAHAVGLNIQFKDGINGDNYQLPEHFQNLLPTLKLSPTLQEKIEKNRESIESELKEAIAGRKKLSSVEQKPRTPDFTLSLKFDFDKNTYGSDFQRSTYSYHGLKHRIALDHPHVDMK